MIDHAEPVELPMQDKIVSLAEKIICKAVDEGEE